MMADDTQPAKPAGAAPKAAPKKSAERPANGPGRPSNAQRLTEKVAREITMLGLGVSALGVARNSAALGADGAAVCDHAERIAAALVSCAETNPQLKRILESGVEASGWLGVLFALGALGADIYANHVTAPELGADPDPEPPASVSRLATLAGQPPPYQPAP